MTRLACHMIVVDSWNKHPDWTAADHLANLGGHAIALGLIEYRLYTVRRWLRTLNSRQRNAAPVA